jgi:type III secretion protein U
MGEKTEKATPKKLRDARKKGQVAKSQDMPASITFVVSIMGTLAILGYLFENLASYTVSIFKSVSKSNLNLENQAAAYFQDSMQVILNCSLPILVIVCIVGVIVNFLVVGPVFSLEALKFDLKKLNPIEGIKQKFKLKVLVELIKSILKITVAAYIIYRIVSAGLDKIIVTATLPVLASAHIVHDFLFDAALKIGIFFLFVAIFDLAFQRRNFANEMKMEKFEVKQEYKDTEGDPMIKGRRNQMFRELAYSEGPRAARRARAIITNPTHIAVALKYDPDEEPAPLILTMGEGFIADEIIKIGISNKIPIMRNVELARELYSKGKIAEYIPEGTYEAVAEILKCIESIEENPYVKQEKIK